MASSARGMCQPSSPTHRATPVAREVESSKLKSEFSPVGELWEENKIVLTRSAKGYAIVDFPEPGILDRQSALNNIRQRTLRYRPVGDSHLPVCSVSLETQEPSTHCLKRSMSSLARESMIWSIVCDGEYDNMMTDKCTRQPRCPAHTSYAEGIYSDCHPVNSAGSRVLAIATLPRSGASAAAAFRLKRPRPVRREHALDVDVEHLRDAHDSPSRSCQG